MINRKACLKMSYANVILRCNIKNYYAARNSFHCQISPRHHGKDFSLDLDREKSLPRS